MATRSSSNNAGGGSTHSHSNGNLLVPNDDPSLSSPYFYLASGPVGTTYISSQVEKANPLAGLGGKRYDDYLAKAMGAVGAPPAKAEPAGGSSSSSTGPATTATTTANGGKANGVVATGTLTLGADTPSSTSSRVSADLSSSSTQQHVQPQPEYPPVITDFKPSTPTATSFPAAFPIPTIPVYYPATPLALPSTPNGSAPASLRMLARGSTTSSLGAQSAAGTHTRASTVTRTSVSSEDEPDGTIGMLLITEFPDWDPPVLPEFKNPVSSNRSVSYGADQPSELTAKLNKQSLYLDADSAGVRFEKFVKAKWDDPLGVAQGLAWRIVVSPVQWAGEKVARQLTTTTNPRNHDDVLRWLKTLDISKTLLYTTVAGATQGSASETVHSQLLRALKTVDGDNIVCLNSEELERRGVSLAKARGALMKGVIEVRKLRLNLIRNLLVQPLLEQAVRRIMEMPQLPPEYDVGIQPPPKIADEVLPVVKPAAAPLAPPKPQQPVLLPPPTTAPLKEEKSGGGLFKGKLKGAFSSMLGGGNKQPKVSTSMPSPISTSPVVTTPTSARSPLLPSPSSSQPSSSRKSNESNQPATLLPSDFDPTSRRKSAAFRLGKMPSLYFKSLVSYAVDRCFLDYARDWETSSGKNLVNSSSSNNNREEKIDGDPITLLKSCFASPARLLENLPGLKQCVYERCSEGDMEELLGRGYWGPRWFKCGGGLYDLWYEE